MSELDRLIGVPGAAAMIGAMRKTFERRLAAQFAAARQVLIEDAVRTRVAMLRNSGETKITCSCGHRSKRQPEPAEITIGFARLADEDDSSG